MCLHWQLGHFQGITETVSLLYNALFTTILPSFLILLSEITEIGWIVYIEKCFLVQTEAPSSEIYFHQIIQSVIGNKALSGGGKTGKPENHLWHSYLIDVYHGWP